MILTAPWGDRPSGGIMGIHRVRTTGGALVAGFAALALFMAACTTPAKPPTNTTTTLPPPGVHTDYLWNCQALGAVQVDVPGGITVSAPATVQPGSDFTIDYVVDPITIPASNSGATISWVGGWNYKFTIPANATFVSASLSGGQGYGGEATVAESGGVIDFAISGSTPALGTADYPVISVTMNASGPGSVIETSVAGTSYADAGFTFSSGTQIGPVETRCFPYAPAPVFSTTQIAGGDPEPTTGCYPGYGNWLNGNGVPSYSYEGPINTLGNASLWANIDGTCTTGGYVPITIVYGPDLSSADASCLAITGTVSNGEAMSADYHFCEVPQ